MSKENPTFETPEDLQLIGVCLFACAQRGK